MCGLFVLLLLCFLPQQLERCVCEREMCVACVLFARNNFPHLESVSREIW